MSDPQKTFNQQDLEDAVLAGRILDEPLTPEQREILTQHKQWRESLRPHVQASHTYVANCNPLMSFTDKVTLYAVTCESTVTPYKDNY